MAVSLSLAAPAAFRLDDESKATAGIRWPTWCKELDTFLTASGVSQAAQKRAVLVYVMGPAVREVYSTLDEKDTDTYDEIKKKLTDHFAPLKNLDFEIFKFAQMYQLDGEPLDEYVVRLRIAAKRCEFTDEDKEIKRQIIHGCSSTKLRQHILETTSITLKQITDKARAAEAATTQVKSIERINGNERGSDKNEKIAAVSRRGPTSNKICFACGYEYPHNSECPAKNSKCRNCKETGHFAKSRLCGKNRVNLVKQEDHSDEDDESEFVYAIGSGRGRPQVHLIINGITVLAMIDSGAQVNVIDQATYELLATVPRLSATSKRLFAYQADNPLRVRGQFRASVEANGHRTEAEFKVVDGKAGNLLGFETARLLDMFSLEIFRRTKLEEREEKGEVSVQDKTVRVQHRTLVLAKRQTEKSEQNYSYNEVHRTNLKHKNVSKSKRNEWKSRSPVWTTKRSGWRGINEYDMTVYQSHTAKKRKKPPEIGVEMRSDRPKFKSAGEVLYRDKLEIQLNKSTS